MFKKLAIAISSLLTACSPAVPTPSAVGPDPDTARPGEPEKKTASVWRDVFDHEFLLPESDTGRRALKLVKSVSKNGESLYLRDRLGNMVFVEGSYLPPMIMDKKADRRFFAVDLDTENIIPLPNEALFTQFMQAVRAQPSKMSESRKISAMIRLALEDDSISMGKEDGSEVPVWHDENGFLTLTYYRYISSGMTRPVRQKCILTVDEYQKHDLKCQELPF